MKLSEKMKSRLARARSAGAHVVAGAKGTLMSGATGAASFYVAKKLSESIETMRTSPYALPLTFVVAGHFVKKKQVDVGAALIGVGGYIAAHNYGVKSDADKATPPNQNPDYSAKGVIGGSVIVGNEGGVYSQAGGYGAYDYPMLRAASGVIGGPGASGVIGAYGNEAQGVVTPSSARSYMNLSDI